MLRLPSSCNARLYVLEFWTRIAALAVVWAPLGTACGSTDVSDDGASHEAGSDATNGGALGASGSAASGASGGISGTRDAGTGGAAAERNDSGPDTSSTGGTANLGAGGNVGTSGAGAAPQDGAPDRADAHPCADTRNDPWNCGACGSPCPDADRGQRCYSGQCGPRWMGCVNPYLVPEKSCQELCSRFGLSCASGVDGGVVIGCYAGDYLGLPMIRTLLKYPGNECVWGTGRTTGTIATSPEPPCNTQWADVLKDVGGSVECCCG